MFIMNFLDEIQIGFSLQSSITWILLPVFPFVISGSVYTHQFTQIRNCVILFQLVYDFIFASKVVTNSF